MPVPPRICVLRLPNTSQLKPTRGDHRNFGSGSFAVEYCTMSPFSSMNVIASATAFWYPVSPNTGTSNRMP